MKQQTPFDNNGDDVDSHVGKKPPPHSSTTTLPSPTSFPNLKNPPPTSTSSFSDEMNYNFEEEQDDNEKE
jgi:hypothetical protein